MAFHFYHTYPAKILSLCLGIAGAYFLPFQPTLALTSALTFVLATIAIICYRYRHRMICCLCLGLLIGLLQQSWFYQQLFNRDCDKQLYQLSGIVESLVQHNHTNNKNFQRFEFRVNSADPIHHNCGYHISPFNRPLALLSWYKNNQAPIHTGQTLKLHAKLSKPRGFTNPAGFNYETWLISQGIGAVGSIQKLQTIKQTTTWNIQAKINQLRQKIIDHSYPITSFKAISLALTIGHKSAIPSDYWQLFKQTGIIHLMVISGLHIGIISAIGFFCFNQAGRYIQLIVPAYNTHYWNWFASWVSALCYTLITGFSIATTRAFIMLSILVLCKITNHNSRPLAQLSLALLTVLVLQPFAIYQQGFWLSFGAVAVLIGFFNHRSQDPDNTGILKQYGLTQWILLIAFSVFIIQFIGFINLASPFINLIAVPVMSVVIIPLNITILLVSLYEIFTVENNVISNYLWALSDFLMQWFITILKLSEPLWTFKYFPHTPAFLSIAALICSMIALLPKGLIFKRSILVCLLCILLYSPQRTGFYLTQLDVGQGLAVVMEYYPENRAPLVLIYDTGKKFSDKFDSGANIIVPYLRRQGLSSVDYLVISHSDNDHSGGANGVTNNIHINTIISSMNDNTHLDCTNKDVIAYHNVTIHFVYPLTDSSHLSTNDQSCVLLIEYFDKKVLLTGDITRSSEQALLIEKTRDMNVITAPHHGSKTSSSSAFIEHTNADIVLFSTGYKNHFHHPNNKVIKRYKQRKNRLLLNSAHSGTIQIYWNTNELNTPQITQWRHGQYFWWFD